MIGFRREIRLPHATAMVVGTIIGASIFVQPSEITGRMPSVPAVLMVWTASGLLTLIGALVCAELASAFRQTGGVYVYLREAYAPWMGFLWGWAMFWSMHSGIIAAIAVVFARYLGFVVPLGAAGERVAGIAAILSLTAVNYVGVRHGTRLQTAFTAGKLLAIALIVGVGFALGAKAPDHFVGPAAPPAVTLSTFLTAMVAGLFAFGGWHMVTYNSEETVEPEKTIPRALLIGGIVVTACYLAMNAVYLYVLPFDEVARSTHIGADLADRVLGFGGGAIMSGIVMFSTFGALAGIVLAGPRVYYAMARDGQIFGWLGALHPRFGTPHRAIVLQGVWASVLVAAWSYRSLFTRVVYTEWVFFGLMSLGLLALRRRRDVARPFVLRGGPILPLLFALGSFAIVVNELVTNTRESASGLGFVALGFPIYLLWGRRRAAEGR